MLKFDYIRQKATNIFKRYGYQEVQPNLLEQVELFERSIGESGEIVQKVPSKSSYIFIKI